MAAAVGMAARVVPDQTPQHGVPSHKQRLQVSSCPGYWSFQLEVSTVATVPPSLPPSPAHSLNSLYHKAGDRSPLILLVKTNKNEVRHF